MLRHDENRKRTGVTAIATAFAFAFALLVILASTAMAAEQVGPTSLTVDTGYFDSATLRIAGPDGYELQRSFEGGSSVSVDLFASDWTTAVDDAGEESTEGAAQSSAIDDALGGLSGSAAPPDGRYKYEVRIQPGDQVLSGQFFIDGGTALSRDAVRSRLSGISADLAGASSGDLDAPSSYTTADFVWITDGTNDGETALIMDNDLPTNNQYFNIVNNGGDLEFQTDTAGPPGTAVVTFERSGEVGIGTTAPAEDLHIARSTASIRLGTSQEWDLEVSSSDFRIYDFTNSVQVFTIEDNGAGTPAVGIFEANPTDPLVVSSPSDGTAKILVDENSAVTAKRFMLELENNGAPGFVFTNSTSGDTWQFAQTAVGDFTVSLIGTGGSELQINKDGRVTMGPGAVQAFNLAPNGSLTINGFLTQGSSRELKTNFTEIAPDDILDRVSRLPIIEWNYKTESADSRHLSPMAEDFYEAFQLGADNKHIAPMDAASVALASVQAMHETLQEKDERIADLEEQNLSLEKRLAAIEAMLQQLTESSPK